MKELSDFVNNNIDAITKAIWGLVIIQLMLGIYKLYLSIRIRRIRDKTQLLKEELTELKNELLRLKALK